MTELIVEGRTWVFPEPNINTDLINPQTVFGKPLREQVKAIFSANRPGWVDLVREGDILIAGKNFGTGSSRPGAMLFKELGIRAIVAESINGLFYRNCVNYALPALECPGVTNLVCEGDVVRVHFHSGVVENVTTGESAAGQAVPEFLLGIVRAGGILPQLREKGYIR